MNLLARTICCVALLTIAGTGCGLKKNDNPAPVHKDSAATAAPVASNPYKTVDQSPLDIAYFPDEYPQKKMKGEMLGGPIARVIYSRPHRKGRIIFSSDPHSLCPYGKPWRLGANEATEIEFFQPVFINGKNISAGRYILYCIPHADKWEIVLNSNLDSWGLAIDPSKNIYTTEVPVQVQDPSIEDFTMLFQQDAEGAELLMAWDNVKVLLPITFSN
ncbi:MAG: DUF2911 domain-containing protein [Ferruginibacter sp.]